MRFAWRFAPGLVLMLAGVPASAATLHCVAVNGNITCAGAGATSCQTVNGHTVCASGDGAVVQSFGDAAAPVDRDDPGRDGIVDAGRDGLDDDDTPPARSQWRGPQRAGPGAARLPPARTPRG